MGIYLADQTIVFLQACLIGAFLGFLYDLFRIARIAIPTPKGLVILEDILFFSICAIVTFFFLLTVVDGRIRVFSLVGEILGGVLYTFTLGQLVMGVSKTIIRIVKGILSFIFRWFLRPVWLLAYGIVSLILRPFVFVGKLLKKISQKAKFNLKVRQRILYNHYKGLFFNFTHRNTQNREKRYDAQTTTKEP